MKKLVVVLLVVAMLFVVGCSAPAEEAPAEVKAEEPAKAEEAAEPEAEQLKFTLVLPMASNEVWNACADGFKAACASVGAEAIVVSPSKPNDVNEMNALIETAIAEGVSGVITQAVNPEGQAPAFEKLDEAGIPFSLVNSDAPESNRLAFIGTGDELGIVAGQAIVDELEGEEIVFGVGLFSTTAPIALSLHNAYKSVMETNEAGFSEAVVFCTESDQLVSVTEWTNAFMTYPEINAGGNICGFGALGAVQAMKDLGYEPGDVVMIAIDDVPQTIDGIKDGYIYGTMTQNFFRMGYEPVIWMNDFQETGATPEMVINDSGTMLVTMENIETYAADMRDPSKW